MITIFCSIAYETDNQPVFVGLPGHSGQAVPYSYPGNIYELSIGHTE